MINIVHEGDEECPCRQNAYEHLPMLPVAERAKTEKEPDDEAVETNFAKHIAVREFTRQPLLLNVSVVGNALPQLAEYIRRQKEENGRGNLQKIKAAEDVKKIPDTRFEF